MAMATDRPNDSTDCSFGGIRRILGLSPHAVTQLIALGFRCSRAYIPHAYLNLGCMLRESQGPADAVALYAVAARRCHDDPLIHYKRGVALATIGQAETRLQP